jgi:NADH:ubiquinone oxidoreductase subunit 5 (subunit L)/multisubunit Na+/H+ antiporter MnhA subunit
MATEKNISYGYPLFALFNFIVGIIILLVSLKIDNLITNNSCTDKDLRNANIGIMLTSTILTCLSASYIGCFIRCKDCFSKNSKKTTETNSVTASPIFFNVLSIILGIILIIFGSIINSKGKSCKDVSSNSNYIWGLGLTITSVSLVLLGINMFKKIKNSDTVEE